MGAASQQLDAHVGQGCTGQHALVLLFGHMPGDQPLPVQGQVIHMAKAAEGDAAAGSSRHNAEHHLGIVAQGFVMPPADGRGGHGLLIQNTAGAEGNSIAVSLLKQLTQHCQLDLTHHMHGNAASGFGNSQGGIFVLKDAQGLHHAEGRNSLLVPQHIGGHHGHRAENVGTVHADAVAGLEALQAGDGHDITSSGQVGGMVLLAMVDAQLVDLDRAAGQGQLVLHTKGAGEQLDKAEPHALSIVAHLIALGGEGLADVISIVRGGQCGKVAEKRLHANTFQCGAGHHREALALLDLLQKRCMPYIRIVAGGEESVQQGFVLGGNGFLQGFIHFAGHLVAAQVEDISRQPLAHLGDDGIRVGTGAVDLVQKEENRNMVAFQQPPHGFSMALHALGAGNNQNGVVHDRYGALHFGGEVHVARGIQPVDGIVAQLEACLPGKNGDAALLFQGMGIKKGILMIHTAQAADGAGKVQYALGKGGFACIHMGQNTNGLLHGSSS